MDRRIFGIVISLLLIFAMVSAAGAQFRDREGSWGRGEGAITERQERQQTRIFEGVANHEISRGEFQALQREQMAIEHNRREAMDRGRMDEREFSELMHQLDAASQHIDDARLVHH